MDTYERADVPSDQHYDLIVHNAYLLIQSADAGAAVYGDIEGLSPKSASSELYY